MKVRTWGRRALAVVAVGAVLAALLALSSWAAGHSERTRWQERHARAVEQRDAAELAAARAMEALRQEADAASVELGIAIIERNEAREYANGLAVRLTEAERQRDAARFVLDEARTIRAELEAELAAVCGIAAYAARDAVYRVCDDDGCGTAFHIGGGRWLTAAHVANALGSAVLYPDGGWAGGYPVTLHWSNPDFSPSADGMIPEHLLGSDYAVLWSHPDHAPAASIRLADAPPPDGQRLTIVGWTGGVKRELAVRAKRTDELDWWGAVELDGGLGHGSSGAPVIDECGVAYAVIAAGDSSYSVGPAVHQMECPATWCAPCGRGYQMKCP